MKRPITTHDEPARTRSGFDLDSRNETQLEDLAALALANDNFDVVNDCLDELDARRNA